MADDDRTLPESTEDIEPFTYPSEDTLDRWDADEAERAQGFRHVEEWLKGMFNQLPPGIGVGFFKDAEGRFVVSVQSDDGMTVEGWLPWADSSVLGVLGNVIRQLAAYGSQIAEMIRKNPDLNNVTAPASSDDSAEVTLQRWLQRVQSKLN